MRKGRVFLLGALGGCLCGASACDWQSSTNSGLRSLLRIDGARAVQGSIADPVKASDATVAPSTKTNLIFPGVSNKAITGVVGPNANLVAIGIAGDDGYWMVPALVKDTGDPQSSKFDTRMSFSPLLGQSVLLQKDSAGQTTLPLSFRAVDAAGNFGPSRIIPLTVALEPPVGSLVISLEWDTPVDLDLHVQVPISVPVTANNPDGLVWVWAKKPAATPSPDPNTADGVLDFDSNANCVIDGRDRENVIWTGVAPAGHYIVRVDAFSLCGQVSAAWHATASYPAGGLSPVQEASGVLTTASTRNAPTAGAGITAFEFDYP